MKEFLLITTIIIIISILIFYIIWCYQNKQITKSIISQLTKYGELKKEDKYYIFNINNIEYGLYILRVGNSSKLSFNSNKIWEKRYKNNINLMDMTYFANLEKPKIVIVYPNLGPYLYYEDENNIKFTNSLENIWDLRIIPYSKIDEIIPILNNGK